MLWDVCAFPHPEVAVAEWTGLQIIGERAQQTSLTLIAQI